MVFQGEVSDIKKNLVPVLRHNRPDTVPLMRIVVGVIRAGDDPRGVWQFGTTNCVQRGQESHSLTLDRNIFHKYHHCLQTSKYGTCFAINVSTCVHNHILNLTMEDNLYNAFINLFSNWRSFPYNYLTIDCQDWCVYWQQSNSNSICV